VKSVANAILTYIMSLFLLPKTLCSAINYGLRKFWWGFPHDKKKHSLSLLSWDNICKLKCLGDLGIWFMASLNNALLARFGWKMVSNQPFLWVDSLSGKYLKKVSFLSAPPNPLSS
jgi:hypothetical protein